MVRVLLVEDSALNIKIWSRTLRSNGYEVFEAYNGAQGIELFKRHDPDVVFMDINMPGINGIAATREILKINPNAIVVPVTAIGQRDMVIGAMKIGCKGFLVKPFKPEKLVAELDRYIEKYGLNQFPNQKILVVQLRSFSHFDASRIFFKEPYGVFLSDDPNHALSIIDSENPDLLLTNSLDMVRVLKQKGFLSVLPTIYLGSTDQKAIADTAVELGVSHVILTPFDKEKLTAYVRAMLTGQSVEDLDDGSSLRPDDEFLLYANPLSGCMCIESFLKRQGASYNQADIDDIQQQMADDKVGMKAGGFVGLSFQKVMKQFGFDYEWREAQSLREIREYDVLYFNDQHYAIFMGWDTHDVVRIDNPGIGVISIDQLTLELKWGGQFFCKAMPKRKSILKRK